MQKRRLFGTDGIRGTSNVWPIVPELVVKLGIAVGKILKRKKKNQNSPLVIIGKDTRICGYIIEMALTSGLCSAGVNVKLLGPAPTPAVAYLSRSLVADLGIVLTASHNPYFDNGIKFFSAQGIKIDTDLEREIETLVFDEKNTYSKNISSSLIGKAFRVDDASSRYIEFLKLAIKNQQLSKVKIILDCANGAAYKIAPTIFQELGAEVICLNNHPNGININENCGSEHPKILQENVLKHQADLGVAFDGDADRAIFVDEKGKAIDGDCILYFLACHFKEKKKLKKNTIVLTDYSNLALDDHLFQKGIKVVRTKNGDKYVAQEIIKKEYSLGGEKSGHLILGNYNSTGDGIMAALYIAKILQISNKKISQCIEAIELYPQIIYNVKVKEKKDFNSMKKFTAFKEKIEKELSSDGRLLVRYSGTENLCRIMIEGQDKKKIEILGKKLANYLKEEQ